MSKGFIPETLPCCPNHWRYTVPLIWTFAFPKREYWCPFCGWGSGMYADYAEENKTDTLDRRLAAFEKFSKEYLSAQALTLGAGVKRDDKVMRLAELPQSEQDQIAETIKAWRYNVKAETIEEAG